jgi:tetratricopeptide (TPR) repeat protein
MSALTGMRKIATFAILILGLLYLYLFHTNRGLMLQYLASKKVRSSGYTRILAQNFEGKRDVRFRKLSAEMLMELGGQDYYDAQQVWNTVLEEQPDPRSYSARAYTYMCQRHYTNAVADYEQAIRVADPRDWTGAFSLPAVYNCLRIARACSRIQSE